MNLELLLYAQAVSPGGRSKRVLAKAIKEIDAGRELSASLIESVKASIKSIQYHDRGMRLENAVKEWREV